MLIDSMGVKCDDIDLTSESRVRCGLTLQTCPEANLAMRAFWQASILEDVDEVSRIWNC